MNALCSKTILAIVVLVSLVACKTQHKQASRSLECVNICRQYVAEAGNAMQAQKRDLFNPRDLTFGQLQVLTPRGADFISVDFLVLNKDWSFETDGKTIVIICAKSYVDEQGRRKYFVAYNSGAYEWLDAEKALQLHWGDYSILPKIDD